MSVIVVVQQRPLPGFAVVAVRQHVGARSVETVALQLVRDLIDGEAAGGLWCLRESLKKRGEVVHEVWQGREDPDPPRRKSVGHVVTNDFDLQFERGAAAGKA